MCPYVETKGQVFLVSYHLLRDGMGTVGAGWDLFLPSHHFFFF